MEIVEWATILAGEPDQLQMIQFTVDSDDNRSVEIKARCKFCNFVWKRTIWSWTSPKPWRKVCAKIVNAIIPGSGEKLFGVRRTYPGPPQMAVIHCPMCETSHTFDISEKFIGKEQVDL